MNLEHLFWITVAGCLALVLIITALVAWGGKGKVEDDEII